MPSFETIIRSGYPVRTGDNVHAERFFSSLRGLVTDYTHERDAARENPALTDVGRREQVQKIARSINAKIEELAPFAENVAARAQELRNRARGFEPKQPTGPIAELRAREIREALRAMPVADRKTVISKAVEQGDETVFAAALGDPLNTISPLIEPELSKRFLHAWVSARDPRLAEVIQGESDLHAAMLSAAESTRKNIESDAGIQPDIRERIGAA